MLFNPNHEDRLGRLANRLRLAQAVTPDLLGEVIAEAGVRVAALAMAGKTDRIARLIACGAWTDAALALMEVELPQWKLRRLVCEDGEWVCSLSKQPGLPTELDDTVDAHHEVLPLAVLCALVDARRLSGDGRAASPVPQLRQVNYAVCCDNFA
jgi:hypothetical protein